MPPPQRLLASTIRGFVCRSCLSKLQAPQRQRLQWASRNINTGSRPLMQKAARSPPKSAAREFKDLKDEASTKPKEEEEEEEEIDDDAEELDDAAILEAMEELIRQRREDAKFGPSKPGGVPKGAVRYFEEGPDGVRIPIEDPLDDEAALDALEREILDMKNDMGDFLESLRDGGSKHTKSSEQSSLENELREGLADLKEFESENLSATERLRIQQIFMQEIASDTSSTSPTSSPPLNVTTGNEASAESDSRSVITLKDGTPQLPVDVFPEVDRFWVYELNRALEAPIAAPEPKGRGRRSRRSTPPMPKHGLHAYVRRVWKAYSMSRQAITAPGNLIPEDLRLVLNFLWGIFHAEGDHNLSRLARIKSLGDDMVKAGCAMDISQHLLYIEAIFTEDSQDRAVQMWEGTSTEGKSPEDLRLYWGLGAKILALNRQPDRALEAARFHLQNSTDPTSYRVLLPVIQSYLKLSDDMSVKRAWALYIRLRLGLASHITMKDYDGIILPLLAADQADLALGVFKDMMLTDESSIPDKYDSITVYQDVVRGPMDLDITQEQIGRQDLQTISRATSKLPSDFNNVFFFGKWLRKLIAEGELVAAEQVFKLMGIHGIMPCPLQMNGLIAAWYRNGKEFTRELADERAWRMIRARIEFVERRSRRCLDPIFILVPSRDKSSYRSVIQTPPATIETFCLLIEQYRRRQNPASVSDLMKAFRKSAIPPNTEFLNQLLMSNMRAHDHKSAVETYQAAIEKYNVPADYYTYELLWGLLKREVDPIRAFNKAGRFERYQKCRGLFKEMMAKLERNPGQQFPRTLYQLIIQSFSLAEDRPGTAIAMRALSTSFAIYPEPETARVVVLQLARLGLVNEVGFQPRRLDLDSSVTRKRIAEVIKILQGFKDERVTALREQGLDFDRLEGKARLEEPMTLLTNLLRFADEHAGNDEMTAAERSKEAAIAMGVPDSAVWQPTVEENSKTVAAEAETTEAETIEAETTEAVTAQVESAETVTAEAETAEAETAEAESTETVAAQAETAEAETA